MTGNYFCVFHRQKHNQHFKLLYFKLNSQFGKSNSILACTKLNLLLINSICLVISSLKMQRKLILTKVSPQVSSVSKETTHKPSKVAAEKTLLSSMHVINTKLFRSMLFIPFDNWKSVLFVIVFVHLRLFQPPYCSFL